MSDVNYLDLEEAVPVVQKTIRFKGEEHAFKEPSVEDFAQEMARIRDIKRSIERLKSEGADEEAQAEKEAELMIKVMLDGVRQAFPTMSEETIRGLTMAQITAIRAFIQEEVNEKAEDEAGNG